MSELIPITTPLQEFKGHGKSVSAVAVFPDKQRMVTGSKDKTLRLWDLKTGVVLKKMEGHSSRVWALAVSRDGQLIASGDENGKVIIWHGETGESLTQLTKAHSFGVYSLDFSPDGTVLATGSHDKTTKLWNTETWKPQDDPIKCRSCVYCVRFSPSGLLAIATNTNIQIYNPGTRECTFKTHTCNYSFAWTPDGTRLLTSGYESDPNTIREPNTIRKPNTIRESNTIREWDTTNWQEIGSPWTSHSDTIRSIAVNPAGTLVASASHDNHIRLWQLSDRRTVAIFKHSYATLCVTFSVDSKHILSGSDNKIILEWAIPNDIISKVRFRLSVVTHHNSNMFRADLRPHYSPHCIHARH
jgi:WD40 repeat protein